MKVLHHDTSSYCVCVYVCWRCEECAELSLKKEWFPLLVIMKTEHCLSCTYIEEIIELTNIIKNMSQGLCGKIVLETLKDTKVSGLLHFVPAGGWKCPAGYICIT